MTVAILGLVAPVLTAASSDDAGLGTDASDDRASPSSISFGRYAATFEDAQDADWYRQDGSPYGDAPACVEVLVEGARGAAELGVWDQRGRSTHGTTVTGPFSLDRAFRAGITVRDLDLARFGAAPREGSGVYAFEWKAYDRASLGPGDAGTGSDASGARSTAVPLSRSCNAGVVGGAYDTRDTYVVAAEAGASLVLSTVGVGTDALEVTLTDAAGAVLATAGADTVTTVVAQSAGLYYLDFQTSSTTPATYLFAMAVGDPGTSPCRPACLEA